MNTSLWWKTFRLVLCLKSVILFAFYHSNKFLNVKFLNLLLTFWRLIKLSRLEWNFMRLIHWFPSLIRQTTKHLPSHSNRFKKLILQLLLCLVWGLFVSSTENGSKISIKPIFLQTLKKYERERLFYGVVCSGWQSKSLSAVRMQNFCFLSGLMLMKINCFCNWIAFVAI